MAITGTGSSADPFIVSTWGELVDVAAYERTVTAYIKFVEDTIIDLGEIYSTVPIVNTYPSRSLIIDFNHAKIINGRFKGIIKTGDKGSSNYPITIKNLIMLNCRNDHAGGISPDNAWGKVYFNDSVLDIHLPDPSSTFADVAGTDSATLIQFSRCSITVSGNGKLGGRVTFKDCNININLVCNKTLDTSLPLKYFKIGDTDPSDITGPIRLANVSADYSDNQITLADSHLTGTLKLPDGAAGSTCLFINAGRSIIEVDCDFIALWGDSSLTLSNSEMSILPANFLSDGTQTTYAPAGPIYERTTEEIRNQQVLYDLGFSVNPNSIAN